MTVSLVNADFLKKTISADKKGYGQSPVGKNHSSRRENPGSDRDTGFSSGTRIFPTLNENPYLGEKA